MGRLFAFSLSSSILLAILYLTYKWMLASENYHRLNRTLLWSIYLIALGGLPLFDAVSGMFTSIPVENTGIRFDGLVAVGFETEAEDSSSAVMYRWLTGFYVTGALIAGILTSFNFLRLINIICRGERYMVQGRKVIVTESSRFAPFSFGRYIVLSKSDFNDSPDMIMLHEKCHVELHHWVDLLFAQGVCILQWFNPAAWLMREELKTVHEYQADSRVIASGADIKEYQLLLIKKAVGARFPSLANSLNHSKLKKRITMMYNQKSPRARVLRPLALLPALGAALWISQIPAVASAIGEIQMSDTLLTDKVSDNSADTQIDAAVDAHVVVTEEKSATTGKIISISKADGSTNTTVISVTSPDEPSAQEDKASGNPHKVEFAAQEMPRFPGGEKAMMQFLKDNITIPEGMENVAGRVVLKFAVEKDGSIGDVQVIKSLDPRLDAEAVRTVKSMPAFIPGKKNGEPVAVYYALPVSFTGRTDLNASGNNGGKSSSESKSVSTTTSVLPSGETYSVTTTRISKDGDKPAVKVSFTDGTGKSYNPTIIVDGEPYGGSLETIEPDDIESITIDKSKSEENPTIKITLKK